MSEELPTPPPAKTKALKRSVLPALTCNDPILLWAVSMVSFWCCLGLVAAIGGQGAILLLSATVYLHTRKMRGRDIY
jgi:hypothetical protein